MTSTRSTPKHTRGALAVAAVTFALGGALAVPSAALGAPAPCERADEYAAQSGAQVFRVDRLEGFKSGRISDVGVAEAKSALVADAAVNSAAVTRLLDADAGKPYTDPLIQHAPPTNATAARRQTHSGEVGPFALGKGTLTSHAQWDPRMACGRSVGEATRAEAAIRGVGIGDLIRVPQLARSRSTTALASGGRTTAAAEVNLPELDLLGGALHLKVLRPPSLAARMSAKDGGRVRYVPAVLEVSGDGVRTKRLGTPGDEFELPLDGQRAESITTTSTMDQMTGGAPLQLPAMPGLPQLGPPEESARVAGPGKRLRITLGNVRQATGGHAIAAKATAIRIAITEAAPDAQDPGEQADSDGYGGNATDRVVLDLGVGLLEAAAVSPEPHSGGVRGAVSAGGAGAGLPITGSPVMLVAIAGGALVIVGAAALAFGSRRRRFRP